MTITTRTVLLRHNDDTKQTQIYLQKKKNGTIEIPGGKVDQLNNSDSLPRNPQTIEQIKIESAKREIQEETGLIITELTKLGTGKYINTFKNRNIETEVNYYYTQVEWEYSQSATAQTALDEDNLIASEWVSFDEFVKNIKSLSKPPIHTKLDNLEGELSMNTVIVRELIKKIKL
jgi:8-oxo-dGTP pyrophosphatase MutT (NUDIX family)